jgi:phosphatidylglycerophosphate synthase
MGLAACLAMMGLVQFLGKPTAILAAVCGLLINFYILADHFDGLQAKKYDRASRFGEFLDHFCDFISGACIIVAVYAFTEMSFVWLIWVSVAYACAFIASHFEHNASGTLCFPLLGPLEALVIAIAFFFIATINPDYWVGNRVLGIRYQYVFVGVFLVGFLWCTWTSIFRIRLSLSACHFGFVAGVSCLAICPMLLPDSWPQFWLMLIAFSAANVASVLAGERLQAPRLVCRELPVLAGVGTVIAFQMDLAASLYVPISLVLLVYAVVRSAKYTYQAASELRRVSVRQ